MSGNDQPSRDLLETTIEAFQRMTVPERPPDADLLAQFGRPQGSLSRASRLLSPLKRRYVMHALLSSIAAAALLLGSFVLVLQKSRPPKAVQVAASSSPEKAADAAVAAPQTSQRSQRESLKRSLAKDVDHAQVIVVATPLDSAPAPSKRPGDLPETLIRFRVKQVLKGKLDKKVITTQTPTAAGELIGRDWIILLSPDYMAGKYHYASHINVHLEPTVKKILSMDKK